MSKESFREKYVRHSDDSIFISKPLASLFKDFVQAGIFTALSDMDTATDGWFNISYKRIKDELKVTDYDIRKAVDRFIQSRFIETRVDNKKRLYKIDYEAVEAAIKEVCEEES